MSNLKARNLLLKQKSYLQFTFTLKEDKNDPSWLNMLEKTCGYYQNLHMQLIEKNQEKYGRI